MEHRNPIPILEKLTRFFATITIVLGFVAFILGSLCRVFYDPEVVIYDLPFVYLLYQQSVTITVISLLFTISFCFIAAEEKRKMEETCQ